MQSLEHGEIEGRLDLAGPNLARDEVGECELHAPFWLHERAIEVCAQVERTGERHVQTTLERCQVADLQAGLRDEAVGPEIHAAGACQGDEGRRSAQIFDRQPARSRLHCGERQLQPLSHERVRGRRQNPPRRFELSLEAHARRVGQRERDLRLGAHEPRRFEPEVALPVIERPLSGQLEREIARRRSARQAGQQPAGLRRLKIQRERTIRHIQPRPQGGSGGFFVLPLQIESRVHDAASMVRPQSSGQTEDRVLAQHRRADLQLVDGQRPDEHWRHRGRQFGHRLGVAGVGRQAMQREPTCAQLIDLEAAAQERPRRGRDPKIIDFQPWPCGVGQAQPLKAEVERDQTVQPRQPHAGFGVAQGAAHLFGNEPLAEAGLGERERPGEQQADRGQRPRQDEHGSSHHVSCIVGIGRSSPLPTSLSARLRHRI